MSSISEYEETPTPNLTLIINKSFVLNDRYRDIYDKKYITKGDIINLRSILREVEIEINKSYKSYIPLIIVDKIRSSEIIHEVAVAIISIYFMAELTRYTTLHGHQHASYDLNDFYLSALLHDIGKCKVDQDILLKKEKLNITELRNIRRHTTFGFDMIMEVDHSLKMTANICKMHHYILQGYPMNVTDTGIPDYVDIISVVDVLCAVIQNRVYHEEVKTFSEIINILNNNSYNFPLEITRTIVSILPIFNENDIILDDKGSCYIIIDNDISISDDIQLINTYTQELKLLKEDDITVKYIIKGKEDIQYIRNTVMTNIEKDEVDITRTNTTKVKIIENLLKIASTIDIFNLTNTKNQS